MHRRRRLNLSVKHEFQRWLLKRIMVSVGLSATLAAVILYLYARQEVGGAFFSAHVRIMRFSDLLLPVVLASSAVSLLSGLLLTLFLPQKIAGPVYRIELDLAAIRVGDLERRIRLRQDDQLHDLACAINATVDSLVSRIGREDDGPGVAAPAERL